jgi:hypothetical protein
MVIHACDSNYVRGVNRRTIVQVSWGKNQDPIQKITKAKRAGGMAQVIVNMKP